MTRNSLKLRTAGTAIAATLAFASTPLLAQTMPAAADPAPILPSDTLAQPLPTATVAPVIALPSAPVAQPQPVAATAQATTPAKPKPATKDAAVRTAPVAQRAAPAAASLATSASEEPAVLPIAPAPQAAAATQVAPLASPVAPTEQQTGDATETLAEILVGLLAAGALGLVLFFALRRRRPNEETAIAREPVATDASAIESAPRFAEPLAYVTPTQAPAGTPLPNQGAAVALPAVAPEDPEAREALIQKLVAARPDRANPFRSRKARRHRAKLIVQSLGRKFENASPRFDLSQYTANWPALKRRDPAMA
jgi:hypothetical protein